jgi:bifunctional UDP-N-acetylglucosamine pyrophosphorylase / glucosamine-1-phosphate N-acetyltransferase
MRSRLLIVPAAGLGTRLGAGPKLLVQVAGIPMIDRLLALFAGVVDGAVVVVHPSFELDVRQHLGESARGGLDGAAVPVTTVVQPRPTGMLDAILLAEPTVRGVDAAEVWITWCDQVAIHPATIRRLAEVTAAHPDAALVMPTVTRRTPYIHLQRDGTGRIVEILHRREGDAMPEVGESDMGLFALPRSSFTELLPRYAREVAVGTTTGERNFLPFVAWASEGHEVVTFPAVDEMEAVGVNTPEELRIVESYLAARESTSS